MSNSEVNKSTDNTIKKVSVVIPVFNEQESLPILIKRTHAACELLNKPYEIILIDDGSHDASAEILTQAAEIPENHIVAVLLNRNYGQHSAIMAGINQVSGDFDHLLVTNTQFAHQRSWIDRLQPNHCHHRTGHFC